jgi:hypothetical protein
MADGGVMSKEGTEFTEPRLYNISNKFAGSVGEQ